ncbi:MAG: PKD domain-containing protein [Methanoregula sp.]
MRKTGSGKFLEKIIFLFLSAVLIAAPSIAAGTETLLTVHSNGLDYGEPRISGDQIVWHNLNQNFGIVYLYNTTSGSEREITDNTSFATHPAISGNLVAYTDCAADPLCTNSAIYINNIITGTRTPVSSGSSVEDFPAIYNNRVVWHDDRNGIFEIYGNGSSPGLESEVGVTGGNQIFPALYENSVVWQDDLSGDSEIYLSDIVTHLLTRITNDPGEQTSPGIYGNRIVWQDNRNGNDEIFTNGTAPGDEYSLTPNEPGIDHQSPAISGDWVVWKQTNATHPSNFDIVVNDTGIPQSLPIALDRGGVNFPSISYSPVQSIYRIVWDEQPAGGNYNVHLYTSSSPGACPVAGFTNDFAGGSAPVTVHFTDSSVQSLSNPITHWFWDFGDGSNSTLENPGHTFAANQAYNVSLIVSNPYCRNAITVTGSVVAGRPVADFTASPTSDVVPATITVTDTSHGTPTQWNWSWGDGTWTNKTIQNPTHEYLTPGVYTVSLIVSNTFGADTKTRTGYITMLAGANERVNMTVAGIGIQDHSGHQYLVFDRTTLTDWTFNPNTSVLVFTPPPDRGLGNISIFTTDPGGFVVSGTTINGTIGSVHFETKDIVPTGFSLSTGSPFVKVNYSIDLSSYPENAVLNTKIWEGATGTDATNFNYIATGSHYAGTNGTAYTVKIIKTNFPASGTALMHMSLNATLVASKPGGRDEVFIERISDDGLSGQVLKTRFLYHNSTENLDYFEAESSQGLSTFGLSFLEGAGNPLQLITLSVASYINGQDSSGSLDSSQAGGTVSGTAHGQQNAPVQEPNPAPVDPGKTAYLYNNANGVITQATMLASTDNHATLSIGKGIVAKDRDGNVLSSVTIKSNPAESLSNLPQGETFSFDGIAYELGPDGATFSPDITLTISYPDAQWGKDYSIKSYDHTTGTWTDLPTVYSPETSTITAKISHFCCFALFSMPKNLPVTRKGTAGQKSNNLPAPVPQPPPTTAVSIFIDMIIWACEQAAKNIIVIAVIAVLALLFYVMRRKKQMDRIRYML